MAFNNFTPAPIQSPMGNQRWLDWFARLDDFLNSESLIIDQKALSADNEYLSPDLEDKFVYEILYAIYGSSAVDLRATFYQNGSEQTGASDYSWADVRQGTSTGNDTAAFIRLGNDIYTSASEPTVGHLLLFNFRSTVETSTVRGNTTYHNTTALRNSDTIGMRNTAEDNEKIRIYPTSGTISGKIILKRIPFEAV